MKRSEILKLESENDSWTHAYLFVGKDETAIEELVRYIIEKKKALKEDVSYLLPEVGSGRSGEIKVEATREFLRTLNLSAFGKNRIAVIRDCEKLNQSSGNTLLKILEEPPRHLTFILTAKSDSILPTIKSRCRVVHVNSGVEAEDLEADGESAQFLKTGFFGASKTVEQIIKEERIELFLDGLLKYFQAKLLSQKEQRYSFAISEIEACRSDIKANLNSRLALECLYLKLRAKD